MPRRDGLPRGAVSDESRGAGCVGSSDASATCATELAVDPPGFLPGLVRSEAVVGRVMIRFLGSLNGRCTRGQWGGARRRSGGARRRSGAL